MADIDITSDDVLNLAQAASLLPRGRNGAKPHISTLVRWITQGVPGPEGKRVYLAAVKLGGWKTSRAALQAFAEALTPQTEGAERTPTMRHRRCALRSAEKALDDAGI